ncbi:MAG: phospholipase D family protein [Candidatus Micrarchaeota archaeon]|nr:phospholipase D family protein [Candidatus Micrarchaeota archaeon]
MRPTFKAPSYSGKECHRYVERLIKEGKSLLIVSPYIDSYYAKFLLANSRGKTIRVLSSSIDSRAKSLLTKGKFPTGMALFAVWVLLLDVLLYLLGLFGYAIYASALLAMLLILLLLSLGKRPKNIALKIPGEFVHAKMYLSEGRAINGSANLTYSGMHKNVEHIEIIEDETQRRELEAQFWKIWNSYS